MILSFLFIYYYYLSLYCKYINFIHHKFMVLVNFLHFSKIFYIFYFVKQIIWFKKDEFIGKRKTKNNMYKRYYKIILICMLCNCGPRISIYFNAFLTRWRTRFSFKRNDFYLLKIWIGVATYFCFIFKG